MNKQTKFSTYQRENGTLKMTNDVVFRKLFGTSQYQSVLQQFLKDVLNLPVQSVTLLSEDFLDTIKTEDQMDKIIESRVDVLVMLENGQRVTIEMQNHSQADFQKRSLYYQAGVFRETIEDIGAKARYQTLKKTIAVDILNFKLFPNDEDALHCFDLYDKEHDLYFIEKDFFPTYVLELPKTKTPTQEVKEWMELFNTGDSESKREEFVRNALEPVKKAALNEKERYWAQRAEEHRWDIDSAVQTGYDSGFELGVEQGIEKGLEQGLEQGVENGVEKVIRAMIEKGTDSQTIISLIGEEFTEQIMRLAKEKH